MSASEPAWASRLAVGVRPALGIMASVSAQVFRLGVRSNPKSGVRIWSATDVLREFGLSGPAEVVEGVAASRHRHE